MERPLADPKAWVLEELLAEGNTPLELIQACHIPDKVLESAPVLFKQRFALPLLSDALQGARVPGAALQLVKLLATPQLGWEGDVDALMSAVKVQACINVLKGEAGVARRNWKGFAHAVAELFADGSDQSEVAKAAREDLTAVLQPAPKKQREAALEQLLEDHPADPVLQDLKALLDMATQHMSTETMLKRLEAKPYTPQPPSPTRPSETARETGGPSNQTPLVDFGVPEDYDGPFADSPEGLTPAATKLGPRRKVTEKRHADNANHPEDVFQFSPEQSPPKRGRKPGSKRKRTILSDDDTQGSPGSEVALIDSPMKRGPGRPRIHPKPDPEAPKRPRGRPRVYEHGAPPRSPARRRKSGPPRLMGPDLGSPLGRGVVEAGAQEGGVAHEEGEEEETTPLKRRRVVADRGAAAGPNSAEKEAENLHTPMADGAANGPPDDSQMEDPLTPLDFQPVHQPGPGGEASPQVGNGARQKGLRMLEKLEAADRKEGQPVDFEMPELGPEEEGGREAGAEFLTMTEDGSNDWCCLCNAKLEEVNELLLCTGCPNATCYACAGVTETPPLEYICPDCLSKLKRKREKEIRAKLGVIRNPQVEAPLASKPAPAPSKQTLPVARLVEGPEVGPSTQPAATLPAPVPEPSSAEPGQPSERPGQSAEQAIPGQEEMPDLPEEEPGAPPKGGELVKTDDGMDEKERKAKERAKTEEGRRNNRYWSDKEVTILREAFVVHLTEENKSRIPWEAIRSYGLRHGVFDDRRGVDLKDKWRNMKRAEDKAAALA